MKRKMRKFAEGGMTDEERYGKVGAEIRRLDPEAFKNRPRTLEGNLKLLKELREKGKSTPPRRMSADEFVSQYKESSAPVESKTESKDSDEATTSPRRSAGGRGAKLPEGYRPRVGSGRYNDPTTTYGERVFSPLKKLTDIFGLRKEESVMRNMGVSREEARRRLKAKEESGMRHGGSVKRMAGGGVARSSASKRADGIAQRGKTRGKYV